MKKYKITREFLRLESAIIEAKNEDCVMDMLEEYNNGKENIKFEPIWNQDEDWQYRIEEIK